MTQISKNEGRTILFVSHNIASIKNLCNVGILLDKGRILSQGEINNVVDEYYILLNEATQSENLENRTDRIGNGKVRIKSVSFSSVNGNGTSSVFSGCELEVKIEYKNCSSGPHDNNHVGISIRTIDGVFVFSQNTRVSNVKLGTLTEEGVFLCRVKNLPLSEDVYFIDVNIKIDEEYADYIQNAARFSVEAADFFGTGRLLNKKLGSALVKGDWSHVSTR
jgi:lipopolysaccharide transport system ATP-binding protein